jgi:predicted GNAT superfamily acetyltransferase
MTKEQTIEQMAVAGCIAQYQSRFGWTDEQMEIFMYKDSTGVRVMEKMRSTARVMYECVNLLPKED